MKELIIVGRPNGSGKTTLANFMVKETGYEFLNADEIKAKKTVSETEAGKIFFSQLNGLLQSNSSFKMESTLSGKYMVSKILEAKSNGFNINLYYIFLKTADDCIQRIKIRVSKGGHYVPDEDVRRRFKRSKFNFWNTYKNLADNWTILYNSIGEGSRGVAFGKKDNYIVESDQLFSTFSIDLKLI